MTVPASLSFFTICSKNFFGYARTLCESVRAQHPGASFHVALCDRMDGMIDPASEPFEIIPLEALAIPGLAGMIERYNITELNTSIKPYVFEYLFGECDRQRVVYLDPDILVVSPLAEVDAHLGVDTDAVLTPHVLDPAENVEIDDIKMLQLGTYNLGFVALNRTDRVREIVRWWSRRLETQCVIDVPNGLFVDQKWANLLPSFIPDTLILHHPGYNVAYWNLPQRVVSRGAQGWVVNGRPLVFVHFSGNDLYDAGVFSRHSPSFTPARAGEANDLLQEYRARVFANGHAHYATLPYAFKWNGSSDVNEHTPESVALQAQARRTVQGPSQTSSQAPASEAGSAATAAGLSRQSVPAGTGAARRVADAWTTVKRARDHAGGWWAMGAKAASVYRRGGMGLMRDTARQLNVIYPVIHRGGVHAPVPIAAYVDTSVVDAMASSGNEAMMEVRIAEVRRQVAEEWASKVQAARDETAAQWSQQVVKARVDTAQQLSHQVRGLHAQIAAQWSEQLKAADTVGWPLPSASKPIGHIIVEPSPTIAGGRSPPRLALMSHDAQAHGAQYLALNLLREFVGMGVEVEVLMQGPGWLEPQFEALAPVHRLYALDAEAQRLLAAHLRARGIDGVIANTTVCGCAIQPFRDAGLRIVSLIHELPGLIAHYGLEDALATLADASERLVVPSRAVRDGLLSSLGADAIADKLVMRAQGLFTRNRYRGLLDKREPRIRLRDRLGISQDAVIALSVGYADTRKGADMLAQATVLAAAKRPDFHVVWVGHADPQLRSAIEAQLRAAGVVDRFHFVGLDFDTDDYYAGADVYALSSREDPFPSVVMESLAVGTPVVAFAGTGGGADLVDGCAGFAVPAFDIEAYAAALLRVVGDPVLHARLGAAGAALIDRDFGFRRYALDLLGLIGVDVARVSAVVPNYNYARYLPERIDSIASQRCPMAEIVVLDDASVDGSDEVLRLQRLYTHPEPVIVRNSENSGSVFRQWLAGVRRTSSEFVWIAEADDAADPLLIETLASAMRRDRGIVMAYAQSARVDAAGFALASDYLGYTDDLSTQRWRAAYTATGVEEVESGLAIKNTIPNVSAVLFRRDEFLDVLERHIDELVGYRIAGDWIAYLYLLQHGRIHYVPEVLNRHRYHGGSVTGTLAARQHYEEVVAAQALARRLYAPSEAACAAAKAYAATLRAHFGLDGVR